MGLHANAVVVYGYELDQKELQQVWEAEETEIVEGELDAYHQLTDLIDDLYVAPVYYDPGNDNDGYRYFVGISLEDGQDLSATLHNNTKRTLRSFFRLYGITPRTSNLAVYIQGYYN